MEKKIGLPLLLLVLSLREKRSVLLMVTLLLIIIIIIITLFKSQIILAKHKCSTNWGDCKSNNSNQINQINQIKSNQMLIFEERGKPEYPEKNLSEQSREPTNSVHI